MLEDIKEILMRRDNLTEIEVENLIEDAKAAFFNYLDDDDQESADNICQEYFNLEPDYLDQMWD